MSRISRVAPLKKSDSPTPGSPQLPAAPQLEVELPDQLGLMCAVITNASGYVPIPSYISVVIHCLGMLPFF